MLTWEGHKRSDATVAESIVQLQQKLEMQGSLLTPEVKLFRMKCVQLMCKANISALSLFDVAHQLETWAGATLGGRRVLMEYGTLHHIIWKEHIKTSITKLCYPHFATMTDGTPCFAAAEGMKLRVITYDWHIKEPLVSLKLLKKSPNGAELAESFRSILQEDLQLDIGNWRAASKDRHATNQAAINRLSERFDVTPFPADCNAHTVSHVPEKFILDELQSILKPWRKGLANGGNLPLVFFESFHVRPRKGTGVRFYIQWEQFMQVQKVGLENIIRDVVDVCVERKYAEKSMRKMQGFI